MPTPGKYPLELDYAELKDNMENAYTFFNAPTGTANVNLVGNDNRTLAELKEDVLEIATGAAGLQTYLTKADADATQPQPEGTMAQVTNDPDPANNGYWVSDGAEWVFSGLQPPNRADLEAVQEEVSDVARRIPSLPVSDRFVPLHHDAEFKVPLWLDYGDLGAKGVTSGFAQLVGITRRVFSPGQKYSLIDNGFASVLWLDEEGRIGAKGLSPDLVIPPQPSAQAETHTDGRTLSIYRAKLALLKRGAQDMIIRIGVAGDSWAEGASVTGAIRDYFETALPRSGNGWQSINPGAKIDGITLVNAGWATYDASATADPPPAGTGIDGQSLYTNGTAASSTLSNVNCREMKIFYRSEGGTLRYRVDGGDWVTASATASGQTGTISLTSLAEGAHTFDVESPGSGQTPDSLLGFYASRDNIAGVQVNKIGNGGMRSARMGWVEENVTPIAAEMQMNLLFHFLATNDYRNPDSPPALYKQRISAWIQANRSANPDVGVVLVCPAQSNAVAINPLSAYRDVLFELAQEFNCEAYSMLDRFGTFEATNNLRQWTDNLHVNNSGAFNMVQDMGHLFFNI